MSNDPLILAPVLLIGFLMVAALSYYHGKKSANLQLRLKLCEAKKLAIKAAQTINGTSDRLLKFKDVIDKNRHGNYVKVSVIISELNTVIDTLLDECEKITNKIQNLK